MFAACVAYPCSFVSCEQRRVRHSLSSLCLCQHHTTLTADDANCVIHVIPLNLQQQQQPPPQPEVTCFDCLQPQTVCRCGSDDRRRRRSAACRGRCDRHERRAVVSARDRCRNGGTPSGLNAGSSSLCQCRAGFFGDRCQLLDPCSKRPCRNGGYCRSLVDLTGLDSSPHSLVNPSLSLSPPLSTSTTSPLFHSRLKTYLFNKSFPP